MKVLLGTAVCAALIAIWLIVRRNPKAGISQVDALVLHPGDVVLLQARHVLSKAQYEALREHLDKLEAHTRVKFAVVDSAVHVVGVSGKVQ